MTLIMIEIEGSVVEMTDKGEFGKMSKPVPAVEYWKDLAEKYRKRARKFGEALNDERDENARLRGKLLQINKLTNTQRGI